MSSRAERRAFFERSLADLDAEHAAGDLSDADHQRLRADYERRLAATGSGSSTPERRPPAKRRPAVVALSVGLALVFAVVAGVLVAQASGRRQPGQTLSGGGPSAEVGTTIPAPDVPDALGACFELESSEAFDCYITYTRANPDDPQGFLYFGLFSINAGIASESQELLSGGETFLRRALELDPGYLEARVNLAVVLERTGRADEAREELTHLEGVDLPTDLQQLVDFVEENLAAESSPTTTSTTAAG